MTTYSAAEWAKMQYTGRWGDNPWNRSRVEDGEIPAEYIGRRNVVVGTIHGSTLLTEGVHFTVDDEEGRALAGAPNPYAIPNILQSLKSDVENGVRTLRQAAMELCEAGWMNFVDEEKAKRLLHL